MPKRLALDGSPARRPGWDRGLGRYNAWWREAWGRTKGVTLLDLEYPVMAGRAGELMEAYHRQRALRRLDADWLQVTTPLHLPPLKREAWICSVLDVIPLDDPRYRQTGLKNRLAMNRVRHAERVVTLAEFTAERIVHFARSDRDCISVIPLPVSDVFFEDSLTVPSVSRPYVMAMADLRTPDPRKRTRWLPALAEMLDKHGFDLQVAGDAESREQEMGRCKLLGRLPDEDLAHWMRSASCFVSLSAYEGQGLPPLEAMASGTPAIALSNSAVTETIGVDDFLVEEPGIGEDEDFPDHTLREIAERITTFAGQRERYASIARTRAAEFRPEKFFARVQDLANTLD